MEGCKENPEKKPINAITNLLFVLISVGGCIIGLCCDILMYRFVKKSDANQQNEAVLVPWKSSNQNTTKEDLQVPLRASIISTISIAILIVGITPLMFLLMGDQKMAAYVGINLFFVSVTLLPIFLVIFTVKQQVKVNSAQPPANLQYHEKSSDVELREIQPAWPNTLQFHEENELHV